MASQRASFSARVFVLRALVGIITVFAVMLPALADAAQLPNRRDYAGIVVDAKSGKVMYEKAADAIRYPASVTKVMTLYILFQELAAGNLTLNTKMRVSKYAASAVPTKLGIKAGGTIAVEDAIKAIVTISANDIARVIAEHISGSEAKFAQRMTATAKALGMSHTRYNNASGLPDAGQTTTVRDQAVLAMAVYQHFPNYYEYFQTRSFAWGKRVYGNHNRLLGSNGVDGIKTGYIGAAGFNLMTAARKDGHHIVVIGFGFESGGSRDAKVRALVKEYLPKSRTGTYVAAIPMPGRKSAKVQVASAPAVAAEAPLVEVASAQPVPVLPAARPTFRTSTGAPAEDMPVIASVQPVDVATLDAPVPARRNDEPMDIGVQPALAAVNALGSAGGTPPRPKSRPEDVVGAWTSDSMSLGAAPAPLGQTRPSAPLVPPVGVGDKGQPIDLMTSGSITPPTVRTAEAAPVTMPTQAPSQPNGWIVQIGASPTEAGAASLLTDAAARIGELGDFRSYVERFEKNGQVFYRARFGGFGGREDANGMCNEIKKAKMSCLAMQG